MDPSNAQPPQDSRPQQPPFQGAAPTPPPFQGAVPPGQGQQQRGLYVMPAAPPRKPSTAWRVMKWMMLLGIVGVCLVSLFFNVIAGSVFAGSGAAAGTSDVNERYISGKSFGARAKVAVVRVDDVIMGDENSGYAEWVVSQLRKAQDDSSVKAIILEVSSPGGGVTAADIVYNHILTLQGPPYNKKVIAFFGDLAASGGYYIAAPADKIIAQPTALTGSIGVVLSSFNIERLLDKVGVESVVFKSAPYKDIMSLYRPVTPEEAKILQGITDEMFGRFKMIVQSGRGLTDEEVAQVSTGAIFTAQQAVNLKLVDGIGYFDDAVKAAKTAISVPDAAVVRYERPPSLSNLLFGVKAGPAGELEKQLADIARARKPGVYYLWPGP